MLWPGLPAHLGQEPPAECLGAKVWTWFDAQCTRFLAVDYRALVERVLQGGKDEEVLSWCFKQGRQPSEEEIEIGNEFMVKRGWRDSSTGSLLRPPGRKGARRSSVNAAGAGNTRLAEAGSGRNS